MVDFLKPKGSSRSWKILNRKITPTIVLSRVIFIRVYFRSPVHYTVQ